ncbi:MAG: efflux RND transporter periplasmic adaptor subunit [Nitrospirae bacterium]|nr:efflux RND transporter periplasmic adaptor subunit [Nitrospirota bacterium]MCL5978598.1 efflux RND transporter periplasmic adaptor subunit [Nitrospirota bacterium]
MIRKYLLPVLAAAGALFAVFSVMSARKSAPVPPPVVQPAQAPFRSYIAGAGIIEASTENIAVGTNLPGIVTKVFVKVGSRVKAGDSLFTLDDRELRSELLVKQSNLVKAKASVEEAKASLQDYRTQYARVKGVTDSRAVSVDEMEKRRNAELLAEAKLESAKAAVIAVEAEVKAVQTTIERLTVRAPVNGEILQINVRPGEYAQTGALQKPLMLLGNLDRLHVRVDVDENDAWRFKKDASALAFIRGNREMKTQLTYERTEPYVIPKKSLTGDSTERVDTRVMQVVYSFDRSQLQVYVGQLMDVFIDAPPVAATKQPQEKTNRGKK